MTQVKRDPIHDWTKTTRSLCAMSARADAKRRANSEWWKRSRWANPEQQAQDTLQQQLVGYWARTKGVTLQDINNPDISLLLRIREDIFDMLDASQQARWSSYWGQVFTQRKKLSEKKLNTLYKDIELAQQRHTIRHKRNPEKQNQDMTVKGSALDQTPPWD